MAMPKKQLKLSRMDRVRQFFAPVEGRTLVYENRKQPMVLYSLKDEAVAEKSIRKVFRILDEDWDVYSDLVPDSEVDTENTLIAEDLETLRSLPKSTFKSAQITLALERFVDDNAKTLDVARIAIVERHRAEQVELYAKAKSGDLDAMMDLMYRRREREYEKIRIEEIE